MPLTSEIVTRALRKARVVARDEAATAEDMSEGVDALNMMMAAWETFGINRAHTALATGDAFPLDAKWEEGTVHLLAERLSPDYSRPVQFDPDQWLRALQAAFIDIPVVAIPSPLAKMPSQYWPNPDVRGGTGSSSS